MTAHVTVRRSVLPPCPQERARVGDEWAAYVARRREYVKLLEGFKWVRAAALTRLF